MECMMCEIYGDFTLKHILKAMWQYIWALSRTTNGVKVYLVTFLNLVLMYIVFYEEDISLVVLIQIY